MMKKLNITLILFMFFALSLTAQIKVGAGLSLVDSNIGLSAKGSLGINEDFDIGAMVSHYFFEGPNATTVDIDLQYKLYGENGSFRIKPLAGLQFVSGGSETDLGINVGLLAEVPITETMELYIEPKYVILGIEQFIISAGVFF